MKATITHLDRTFTVNLNQPLHLSLPLHNGNNQLRAWWVKPLRIEAVEGDTGPYLVQSGSPVNFRDIHFNPHGHGTHTECVGHITEQIHSVNEVLRTAFFTAQLISTPTTQKNGDELITKDTVFSLLKGAVPESLVIRTLPNEAQKGTRDYSGNNPPYLETALLAHLRQIGVKHLLLDLPSVDRESDGGALAGHKAFWGQPGAPDLERTITELIYVPDTIEDGEYLLELQIAPFQNDASPSRPILYAIQ